MWKSQMNQIHTVTTATSIKYILTPSFFPFPRSSKIKCILILPAGRNVCHPQKPKNKNKIGSQSLPINIKACKYQGSIYGGKESHRTVISQCPTTLLKELNRCPSRNSEPDSPARRVLLLKGHILLKNAQTPFLIPETVILRQIQFWGVGIISNFQVRKLPLRTMTVSSMQ